MLCPRAQEIDLSDVEDMDTSEAEWCWFYLAECGIWHTFENNEGASCSVTSKQIEQHYSRNQQGVLEFFTAKYTYRLDFSVMKQINMTTGTQRPIKRALHTATGFRFICDNLALPVPSHWERVNNEEPFQLISLKSNTHEFKEVANLFARSMTSPIRSIQRIQNIDLWEFFCRKKAQLRKTKRSIDIEEKMLFHGTCHRNVPAICTHNFDWRLCGSNGDVFGKGTYFARDAKYSSKFCKTTDDSATGLLPLVFQRDSLKFMFLARVLIGDYTAGSSKYLRPPSKDRSNLNLYDSCVDDVSNPKIYVIFDHNQIYPEYLIEF